MLFILLTINIYVPSNVGFYYLCITLDSYKRRDRVMFNVSLHKTDNGVDELPPLVQEQGHLLWYHK